MPKRAASATGRAPKFAKFTSGGKPRCDRCYKSNYAKSMLEVNGRKRHRACWPALSKIVWEERGYTVNGKQYFEINQPDRDDWYLLNIPRPFGEIVMDRSFHDQRCKKIFELMNKEFMMKAVNCVSRRVRDALLRTSGAELRVNVALALADK